MSVISVHKNELFSPFFQACSRKKIPPAHYVFTIYEHFLNKAIPAAPATHLSGSQAESGEQKVNY